MVISDSPKQASLATAASSQVSGSKTGQGVVRKILGSVVIGEGTTTITTDMGVLVPVITQTAPFVDTSMESGLLSEEESGQSKLMSYKADKSADELDTLDGENDFMNLSAMSTTMNVLEAATENDQQLVMNNNMNTTLGEQLINVSIIQQEAEAHTNISLRTGTTTNVASSFASIVNTISPDKTNEFKPQVVSTSTIQPNNIKATTNDDGFTVVQRTRKPYQQSALDQLKKQHNISKHGLPTPSVSFRNSHIALVAHPFFIIGYRVDPQCVCFLLMAGPYMFHVFVSTASRAGSCCPPLHPLHHFAYAAKPTQMFGDPDLF
jgi:hypothetical protein